MAPEYPKGQLDLERLSLLEPFPPFTYNTHVGNAIGMDSAMDFEMEGFDDAEDQLNEMAEKAKELDGENEVSHAELCNSSFMNENTSYSSFEELLEDGGYEVESSEDFEAIPEDEFDNHIRQNTSFDSWEEMLSAAGQAWVTSEIGLD